MRIPLVFFEYIAWHYSEGMREFLTAWQNMLWFVYRFFSVSTLVRTFFQPFHRLQESYGRGFDPQRLFETAIVNSITRLVGAFVRTVMIFIAGILSLFVFIVGVVFFVLFLATPIVVPLSMIAGLALLLFG